MNTTYRSPVDLPAATAPPVSAVRRILVWDAPVRVFHWLTVLCFAGAYLTAETERWRLLHVTLGYTMAGLLAFRLVWGLVGTRHARFVNFVRGPAAVLHYLRGLRDVRGPRAGRPPHHPGHNPAGALAIVGLLGLSLVVTAAGWATYNELGGERMEDLHELAANALLALVGVHVAAVLLMSRLYRGNLVATMITGRRPGRPEDAVPSAWRSVAVLMLVAVAVFWGLQWAAAPLP